MQADKPTNPTGLFDTIAITLKIKSNTDVKVTDTKDINNTKFTIRFITILI